MDKIIFNKNSQYLSFAEQDSGFIGILMSFNNMDISELVIRDGKEFIVLPSNNDKLIEFFYILSGELKGPTGEDLITTGDSFYVQDLREATIFKAIKEAKILYITNESIVSEVSNSMKKLHHMISQLELKDQYTKSHSGRVNEWMPLMAKTLHLSPDQTRVLLDAALFHDLGKIEISDEILHKPSSLTKMEFDRIKDHPSIGRIIADSHQLAEVGKVIEQHHERIDGSGYPYGLKGAEIQLEAKIIAVIDSYDAMTSDRPYRKGMTKEEAIVELRKCSGSHYEPYLVEAFIKILLEVRNL